MTFCLILSYHLVGIQLLYPRAGHPPPLELLPHSHPGETRGWVIDPRPQPPIPSLQRPFPTTLPVRVSLSVGPTLCDGSLDWSRTGLLCPWDFWESSLCPLCWLKQRAAERRGPSLMARIHKLSGMPRSSTRPPGQEVLWSQRELPTHLPFVIIPGLVTPKVVIQAFDFLLK